MEIQVLEKAGLTKNESIVYLTLLRLGTSKSGEILKVSGLNSGKIYEILDSLKKKGLISESIINNVKHFTSAPPYELLNWLDKKKKEIEEDKRLVEKQLSEFNNIRGEDQKQVKAVTYVGFGGLRTAIWEVFNQLKAGDEVLGMGITSKKARKFNDFWIKFGLERGKRRITAKNLFSEKSEFYEQYEKIKFTENRLLEGLTPVTVDIFGKDKVLILNYNEPVSCIIVYDKNTATSFRNFFYQLWQISKK